MSNEYLSDEEKNLLKKTNELWIGLQEPGCCH